MAFAMYLTGYVLILTQQLCSTDSMIKNDGFLHYPQPRRPILSFGGENLPDGTLVANLVFFH